MSGNGRQMYRAFLHFSHTGASVWCASGTVSQCGHWVDCGDIRHRMTDDWHETKEAAKAVHATEVAEMGVKLLQQANDLANAKEATG